MQTGHSTKAHDQVLGVVRGYDNVLRRAETVVRRYGKLMVQSSSPVGTTLVCSQEPQREESVRGYQCCDSSPMGDTSSLVKEALSPRTMVLTPWSRRVAGSIC